MLNRKNKIFISFTVITFLIFACQRNTSGLKQSDIKPLISVFLAKHVEYHEFNDDTSRKTLNNLISFLDPGKYYFYDSDIESFLKHKDKLDDYVEDGNYTLIFEIQKVYNTRFAENLQLFNELIKLNYDFNKDESIIIDSDKINWARTREEMKERWRKNIKLQLLNRLSIEKNIDESKEKLKKKYDLVKKRIDEIDEKKMISIFINAFSTALDPHSNYLTQEEHEDFMISTKLKLEGIGVLLKSEDGYISVESIIPGGAAAKLPDNLKLKPNDKIVAVAQADSEPVDVIDMDLRDVVNMIRGKKGTTVKLTIIRAVDIDNSQPRMIIPITREEIKLEDKSAKSEVYTLKKKNKSEVKIGYIKLPSFYLDFDAVQENNPQGKSSSRDIIYQINKLVSSKVDGMIIDLRGNPGGALTEAINIAGMFIDEGPVVQILAEGDNIDVMEDRDPGSYYEGPMVVLIDKFSASASEIFAGAMKDYGRGIIVGATNTFGKGSVQTYNVLADNNGAMKITTALFYQPEGTSNQLNGISPDIVVPEITSIWDMGEDKLTNALQWKKIKKSDFKPYKKYINTKILSSLKNLSSARINLDKKFKDLVQKIKDLKEKQKEKTISLKEQANIEDQKQKDLERMQKNEENPDKLIDVENDIFLKEAFNITSDYIDMLK